MRPMSFQCRKAIAKSMAKMQLRLAMSILVAPLRSITSTRILARHPDKIVWEIMEATEIARLQDHCVSAPSIALSEKELKCLQGPMFIFANAHS